MSPAGVDNGATEHRVSCANGAAEKVRKMLCDDRRSYAHNTSTSIDDFHFQRGSAKGMSPRICICCGQPMAVGGKALSRNPNICATCLTILDGKDDSKAGEHRKPADKSDKSHAEAAKSALITRGRS